MPPPGSRAAHVYDSPSASAIFASRVTVTGHHVLHIEDYARTKEQLPNGKGIESRPFRVGGFSWFLRYYPNGESSRNIHVPLPWREYYWAGLSRRELSTVCSIGRSGKPVLSRTKEVKLYVYAAGGDGYGLLKLVKWDFLESSGRSPQGGPLQYQGTPVLFKAELFGAMREGTAAGDHCIQMDGILAQVFKNLLHFVYTDLLPETPETEGPQEGAAMAQHLLEAADRHDLQRLKLLCERKLCGYMDGRNHVGVGRTAPLPWPQGG
ncbi:unnamed protein product [Urochloa decumbens]|uniref:MATH domain-containing protein n=1 Tax=Urochloa decumbens TaxID=240449 RepID=A0ABC8XFT3_9POAL